MQENVCERMGVRESVCVRACMCAHLKKRERERIRERGERERELLKLGSPNQFFSHVLDFKLQPLFLSLLRFCLLSERSMRLNRVQAAKQVNQAQTSQAKLERVIATT